MARDHGRVLCKIWQDKDFRALSRTAQALYMQLLSQPNVNNAGVLPLMLSKWAKGCDEATSDSLVRDLAELVDDRFVVVDTDTEEVLVRSFIRNDGVLKQPNVLKNALRAAEAVESPTIRLALAAELRRTGRADAARTADLLDPPEPDPVPVRKGSETHREPFQNGSAPLQSDMMENPRSNPSGTLPDDETLPEPFADPCGVGEGVGEGENLPSDVGWVGGARASAGDARDAHTREETPTQNTPQSDGPPGDAEPSRYCPRHPIGSPDPCRACQHARQNFDLWHVEHARQLAETAATERHHAAEARRAAIDACPLGCADRDGYRPDGRVCDHDPDAAERNRRGIELARAALAERRSAP
jgi:hypothetical protein